MQNITLIDICKHCFDWQALSSYFRAGIFVWQNDAVIPTHSLYLIHTDTLYSLLWLSAADNVCTPPGLCWHMHSDGMLDPCLPGIHAGGRGDHFKSSRPTTTDRQVARLCNELWEQCCVTNKIQIWNRWLLKLKEAKKMRADKDSNLRKSFRVMGLDTAALHCNIIAQDLRGNWMQMPSKKNVFSFSYITLRLAYYKYIRQCICVKS